MIEINSGRTLAPNSRTKQDALPLALTSLIRRLWAHLSQRRHHQFIFLGMLTLVSAFAEIISLGAVLPFLGILVAPNKVFRHPFFYHVAKTWGINAADQLVLPITILFGTAALAAGVIRVFLSWVNTRLAFASGAEFSMEIYRRTLYQPYQVHMAVNSSEVISSTAKVQNVVFGVLLPGLTLISSATLLVAITTTLFIIDPLVASVAIFGFGAGYGTIALMTKRKLQRYGEKISTESTRLVKAQQEGLGGIRDILIDGTQKIYCDTYQQANQSLRLAMSNSYFIGQSPRYILETLAMLVIAGLAYELSRQDGGVAKALPELGVLALGAQRLLPALQQSYYAWTSIVSTKESLADVVTMLEQPLPDNLMDPEPLPLAFQDAIRFDGVRFRYSSGTTWVIDGLDLEIPRGTRIGFVGSTGSGKSTTLDLLMGLLAPTEGMILVDGIPINGSRVRAWQKNIAHVPQSIYLADNTLAENIAIGIPKNNIDMQRVRNAAQQAQIAEFIESNPEGYDAIVGERGIRLSGGQRQRIGIARALYKQASVLIFDEATSALDNATEQSVMNAIEGLRRDLTILIIAHRLTTVKACDTVVELSNGRVVAQGTFEQLVECSPSFRQMAQSVA